MRFQGFVDFQPRALAVCIGPKHGLGTDVFVGCWVVGPPGSNRRLTPASMSPAPSDFSSPDPLVATRNGPAPTRKNGATCLPDRVRNRRRVASDFSSSVVLNRFPIPIVSESSKPPFFCHSFSRALLRANSCVLQLRVFCFPGSSLTPLGSLRLSSRSLWKQKPLASGCPKKMGQEKGENSVMAYLNSITLVGFVGSDPEQRQAKGNGSKFTVLSVATQRSWKNADDEWSSKTEWHRVVVIWN